MSATPKFITTCNEDEEGNLILEFPEELIEAMGWTTGTTLDIDVIGSAVVFREVCRTDIEEAGGVDEGE